MLKNTLNEKGNGDFKMGLFTKKIGPVFLKETSNAKIFIEKMQSLQAKAAGEVKQKIEKQINLAKYGEFGENNIAFELRNSGMDMYILHDIYLEKDGLSAQIDYIVVTRQHVYIIECKNLIGNIEIDNTGAFVRTYQLGSRYIKEGIYSPITQNERHLQVIREVRKSSKTNIITRMLFEKNFEDTYRPIVVLANPKTYLNAKYAKKEVKEKVIRADQLVAYMKRIDAETSGKAMDMSTDEMLNLAQFFLSSDIPGRSDYARKYEEMVAEFVENNVAIGADIKEPVAVGEDVSVVESIPVEKEKPVTTAGTSSETRADREELIRKLKAFRLEQSRKENIKPYYIFNDAQMNDLLDKAPRTKEELLKVSGFGNVKVEKYGEEILKIIV